MAPKLQAFRVNAFESLLEFNVNPKSKGIDLFNTVCNALNIREKWWFGLYFINKDNEIQWIRHKNQLTDQNIPNFKSNNPVDLFFRICYFPEDVSIDLIQDITQRFFYYQIKESILKGDIYCAPDVSVLLASYSSQIKFGDYTSENQILVENANLIPERVISKHTLTKSQWSDKICNWWKDLSGTHQEVAIIDYLKIAQDLEMFGITYFPIRNKRGTEVVLGVDPLGLNIYHKNDLIKGRIGFPWSEIHQIKSNGKKFFIKSVDKSAKDFVFYTNSEETTKRIHELVVGNRELYAARRGQDSIEIQQMRLQASDNLQRKLDVHNKYLNERENRAKIEAQLRETESNLTLKTNEYQKIYTDFDQSERRIQDLELRLQDMSTQKKELSFIKDRLEENVKAISITKDKTSVEYENLMRQNDMIKQEMEIKNSQLNKTTSELEKYQNLINQLEDERERLRRENERLELESGRNTMNRNYNNVDESSSVDFEELSGTRNRDEEDRKISFNVNHNIKNRLDNLSYELDSERDLGKVDTIDKEYTETKKKGEDKFSTLKKIRSGKVRRRIDEFEAM